jgi:hypothetical protein
VQIRPSDDRTWRTRCARLRFHRSCPGHAGEHFELTQGRRPASFGGEYEQTQRERPIGRPDDAGGADDCEAGRSFGPAHVYRVLEQTYALLPQARGSIADDNALGQLRGCLDVAALSGRCKLVYRVVVTSLRIELASGRNFG